MIGLLDMKECIPVLKQKLTHCVENGRLLVIGSNGTNEEVLYNINYSVSENLIQRDVKLLFVIAKDNDLAMYANKDNLCSDIQKQLNDYSYNQAFTAWGVTSDTVDLRPYILKWSSIKQTYDSLYNAYNNASNNNDPFSNQQFKTRLLNLLSSYGYTADQTGYDKYLMDIEICDLATTNVPIAFKKILHEMYGAKYGSEIYLAFVVNKNKFSDQTPSVAGAATLNGKNSIFLYNQIKPLIKPFVFAHELGHNLGLDHPFEEFGIPETNTLNYMDYNQNHNMFWFWQWKYIQTK
jgi:hypothetical protein